MDFKEQNKEYQREYYEKNKEKNKEKIKERDRKYYEKNKEQILEYKKTPKAKKVTRISKWRYQKIIFFDFDLLYDIYISTTHCDLCNVKLTIDRFNTSTTRCLDHDHNINDYDNVRNILCNSCNVSRR